MYAIFLTHLTHDLTTYNPKHFQDIALHYVSAATT